MKKILKTILMVYLKFWARIALGLNRPRVIVVAGSINKPFFKKAIADALADPHIASRVNPKNFNTEIGMPLAVLDLPSGYNSYRDWLPAIVRSPLAAFRKMPPFLILSLGSAQAGDMKYLLSIIRPEIAVITDITQRHLEGYRDMDELYEEYAELARRIPDTGLLVLNKDNLRLRKLPDLAVSRIKYFSVAEKTDCSADSITRTNDGEGFRVQPGGEWQQLRRYGKHHIQAFLAAQLIKRYVAKERIS